ncbi:MAG: hypothetical protein JWM82_2108 [Myxococcales bacterium]|nr:hypothetical protein [Myxococcales bacterium]
MYCAAFVTVARPGMTRYGNVREPGGVLRVADVEDREAARYADVERLRDVHGG